MKPEQVPVAVEIQGKEYRIACPPEEQEGLLASAKLLDQKMQEIRSSGKVIGLERIAVMAALNIAHELLRYKSEEATYNKTLGTGIRQLQDKVQDALSNLKQMEL